MPKQKLHLDKLKRFGCMAYFCITITDTKFSKTGIKVVFVGYSKNGYIGWHPTTGRFLCSKHVRFKEKINYETEYKNKQIKINIEKEIIDTEQVGDQNLDNEEIISFKEKATETIIDQKIDLKEKEIELDLQKKKKP